MVDIVLTLLTTICTIDTLMTDTRIPDIAHDAMVSQRSFSIGLPTKTLATSVTMVVPVDTFYVVCLASTNLGPS